VPCALLGRHDWVGGGGRFGDERTVVTGGRDGAVLVWDTAGPAAPRRLGGHAGIVTALDVRGDRRRVLSGAADGTRRRPDDVAWSRSGTRRAGNTAEIRCEWDSTDFVGFRLRDSTDAVVGEVHLDAAPVGSAAVNSVSFAILDRAGRVSRWRVA
jgi:WD40 repeat protein